MKAILQIGTSEKGWTNVTITGPDNICIPIITYLSGKTITEKRTMVINFYEEEEDE